jgi:hypothetical protein
MPSGGLSIPECRDRIYRAEMLNEYDTGPVFLFLVPNQNFALV